jgi:hypothetical protein
MKNILYDYKLKNSFYVDSTWESEYLAKGASLTESPFDAKTEVNKKCDKISANTAV